VKRNPRPLQCPDQVRTQSKIVEGSVCLTEKLEQWIDALPGLFIRDYHSPCNSSPQILIYKLLFLPVQIFARKFRWALFYLAQMQFGRINHFRLPRPNEIRAGHSILE
jgi:hypothetical protein